MTKNMTTIVHAVRGRSIDNTLKQTTACHRKINTQVTITRYLPG